MKMAWVWGGGGAEVIDKLVRVVLRIITTCVYNSRYECLQTLNINTESPALKALMSYRGFHEKGTHGYLCPQG